MSKIAVNFEVEKETKNTIKFKEHVESILDTPKVGTIYIPKVTLKELGYEPGKPLRVEVHV